MALLRDIYGNSSDLGFTIEFFRLASHQPKKAFLLSPFFSIYDPIEYLTNKKCNIKLLIRLCSITTPDVIKKAFSDELVEVRYYTDRSFHAKMYIIDDKALIGSANLTDAGLHSNTEVSIVMHKDQSPNFDELPSIFSNLWEYADVMTEAVLLSYEKAFYAKNRPKDDDAFDHFLLSFVDACAPPSIKVGSKIVTKKREFLQGFRKKYDLELVPAFREVRDVFISDGRRRKEFVEGDIDIEISRFLGWVRIVHAEGDQWAKSDLIRAPETRARKILRYIDLWQDTDDITNGDKIYAEKEIENIERIRSNFNSDSSISELNYEEIFDTLIGCHAFLELLRFTAGGLYGLRLDFSERNSLKSIRKTLAYLLHGPGDQLSRAYDCIHDPKYKLSRFGESCTMELVGWMNKGRPPINGRTIKALRFLGFDVSD